MSARNVSKLINRLADKHDINVTKLRDIVEDLRRDLFAHNTIDSGGETLGLDLYAIIKRKRHWHVAKLRKHGGRG